MEQAAKIPDDFGYGEDQALLRREARRVLEAECTTAAVRRAMESPSGHDEALWARIVEMGWTGLAIPEAYGGTGMSMVSLATLMEEMGRVLLPSPFLGTLFATLVILEAASPAQKERWLPEIAAGRLRAAAAVFEEEGGWDPGAVTSTATRDGNRIVLSGAKALVVDAPGADLLVGTFREGSGVSLFVVDARAAEAGSVRISPDALVDLTRRSAAVELRGVIVGEEARLGVEGAGRGALDRAMPRVLTALAAEMAGGADRVLGMTVEYAKVREQFGRSIGAFQAVKHPLVNVMVDVEMTRSLVYRAAAAIDHVPARAERLSRMAKALASDTYGNAVARAVQLHGGIGFTWECDVHLFFRRAQWSRAAFGDAPHQRRWISDALFAP